MAKNKGGFRGSGGRPGGGMNMNMVKQAQKMQEDLARMQEEAQSQTYSAQSGGGAVTAVVSGKKELVSLEILPDAADPQDVEMLQDLIIAAVNEAMRKADAGIAESMSKITGGLGGLAGLGGLGF